MNAICLFPDRTVGLSRRSLMAVLGLVVACDLAAVAAFGDESDRPSKTITSQPVKVQVSENWSIEVVTGPATKPAPVPRLHRVAANEPQQNIQPVPDQPRANVAANKLANECYCCCAHGNRGLTQITLNNITPLGLYYDSRNLPPKGRWRP